jgi:energy-coupling factor transport system ATP-binding protein
MGRNGSGKSTLLAHLAGVRPVRVGRVEVSGAGDGSGTAWDDPSRLAPAALVRRVGFVPQDAGVLLNESTVAAECAANDRDASLGPGTTERELDRLVRGIDPAAHPRDLSEGQRLAVALAVVLAPAPPLVLLDEPTRGLDYEAKEHLGRLLGELAAAGRAVVLSTHDVEVVASVAQRVVVMADGEVVADGPARDVVCHSPVFAPQVAKVLAPDPWLTVAEVAEALDGSEAAS